MAIKNYKSHTGIEKKNSHKQNSVHYAYNANAFT